MAGPGRTGNPRLGRWVGREALEEQDGNPEGSRGR